MKFTKEQIYKYGMRDVVGYEGYGITSCGRVYSYRSGRFLTPKLDRYGYYQVGIYDKSGKQRWVLLHRLVAQAYLDNSDNLPDAAHKDECSTHNWLNNLEWLSRKDNLNAPLHRQRVSDNKIGKKHGVRCVETGIIYKSCRDAEEKTGISRHAISKCCRGICENAGKYHWQRL